MLKNLPCSAEDSGSIPGLGRSHMLWSNKANVPQLLDASSRAFEAQLLKPTFLGPMLCNKRRHHNEKPECCN